MPKSPATIKPIHNLLSDCQRPAFYPLCRMYVSVKEPYRPPLWWHQDWWCWDHPVSYRQTAPQIAVLCYLTDTNAQNGALRILPASHRKSAPIHTVLPEAHGHTAEELEPGHIALSDLSGQLTLCLRAGDAVVIDYRLLHGTHGNASHARRDCILPFLTPFLARIANRYKSSSDISTIGG
jgi:ectoine hydroxylase-related dioxygenase (phytanoyl-CoA dioxygenase family)